MEKIDNTVFMKIHRSILIIFIILAILLPSCDNSIDHKSTKSIRDYTWTIDTLELPDPFQNLMSSMYAANENDIYLVGHNSTGDFNGGMWNYNGEEWATVKVREQVGAYGTLNAVHGSAPNNIWAVGGSFEYATILQYNGIKWKKHLAETSDGIYGTPLSKNNVYSVYVESETAIWACDNGGLVYHYDGNNWDIDTIKVVALDSLDVFQLYNIVKYNEEIFVTGVKRQSNEGWGKLFLLKKKGSNWEIEDSSDYGIGDPKFDVRLFVSQTNNFYSLGTGGIYLRLNKQWENIFSIESSINDISVESENNILAVGSFGKVFHYNGNDWYQITELEQFSEIYVDVQLFTKSDEAIIVGWLLDGYPQKTIVAHGK